jgi:hypothetical protein
VERPAPAGAQMEVELPALEREAQAEAPAPAAARPFPSLGPVLTVFDAQTGTPICDPSFAVLVQADAGSVFDDVAASACTPGSYDCPMTYDGGATPCPFYLRGGLGYSTEATVDVRAPGYEHGEVSGVSVRRSGCVPPFFPASHLNVNLIPLPRDAGAAADAQLSSKWAAK